MRDIASAMLRDTTRKSEGLFRQERTTESLRRYQNLVDKGKEVEYDEMYAGFTASCAMGGAAFVLGLDGFDLERQLMTDGPDHDGVPVNPMTSLDTSDDRDLTIGAVIADWNDDTEKSKAAIGKMILKKASEELLSTKFKIKVAKKRWMKNYIENPERSEREFVI